MSTHRYYRNLDFSKPVATHRNVDNVKSRRELAKICLVAMARINQMLGNLDVSVDVHLRSRSWAVLSLQGKKTDFIKFIDLGDRDVCEIQKFLRTFDREQVKIDANPFIAMSMKDHLFKIGKDELY